MKNKYSFCSDSAILSTIRRYNYVAKFATPKRILYQRKARINQRIPNICEVGLNYYLNYIKLPRLKLYEEIKTTDALLCKFGDLERYVRFRDFLWALRKNLNFEVVTLSQKFITRKICELEHI